MDLHERLRLLAGELGSVVFDDADSFRGAVDDFVDEGEATTGDINILVDAIRLGAFRRMMSLLDAGGSAESAVKGAGDLLARERGSADITGSRWACAVLGFAVGQVGEGEIRRYRTMQASAQPPHVPPTATPPQDDDPASPGQRSSVPPSRGAGDSPPTAGASPGSLPGDQSSAADHAEQRPPSVPRPAAPAAPTTPPSPDRPGDRGGAAASVTSPAPDGDVPAAARSAPPATALPAETPPREAGKTSGAAAREVPQWRPGAIPTQRKPTGRHAWIAGIAALVLAVIASGTWYAVASSTNDGDDAASDAAQGAPTDDSTKPGEEPPTERPTEPKADPPSEENPSQRSPAPFRSAALYDLAREYFDASECERPVEKEEAPVALQTPDKELVKCRNSVGSYTGTFWCKRTVAGLREDRDLFLSKRVGPLEELTFAPAGHASWSGLRASFRHEGGGARVYWESPRDLCAAELQSVGRTSLAEIVRFWRGTA